MTGTGASIVFLIIGIVFAGLAALLHVYIYTMESISWGRPATWKRFGIGSQADADTIRPMALNQGFYNLFLAVVTVIGLLFFLSSGLATAAYALVFAGVGSMLAAALVLVISNPRMARSAITQGAFPLLAVVALAASLL